MVRHLGFALTVVGLLLVGQLALGLLPFLFSAAPSKTTPTRVATRAAPTPAPTSTAAPRAPPSSRPTTIASPANTPPPTAFVLIGGAAGGTPSVQISPAVGQLQPGQTFELQVLVDDPRVTRGAQFGLSFNPALLELTGVDAGTYYHDWAKGHGASTMAIPDVQIDPQRGKVMPFGIVILGGPMGNGPTGPGLLATIHGRAKAGVAGRTLITLDDVILSEIRTDEAGMGPDVFSAPTVAVGNAIVVVGSGIGPLPPPPTPLLVRSSLPGLAAGSPTPIGMAPLPTWTPAQSR